MTMTRQPLRRRTQKATPAGRQAGRRRHRHLPAMRQMDPARQPLGLRPRRSPRRQDSRRVSRTRASTLFKGRRRLETPTPHTTAHHPHTTSEGAGLLRHMTWLRVA